MELLTGSISKKILLAELALGTVLDGGAGKVAPEFSTVHPENKAKAAIVAESINTGFRFQILRLQFTVKVSFRAVYSL